MLLVIQIDQDFERRVLGGQGAGSAGDRRWEELEHGRHREGYVAAIVEAFNVEWRARRPRAGAETPWQVQVVARAWYNPNLETRWNMIPSLIGTLTLLETLMLTAMSVAREREQGTFDQLLVTPFRPVEIMAGKALPSMIVGCIQATTILSSPSSGFVFHSPGRTALSVGLLFFLLAAVGIGLFVSSIAVDDATGDALFFRDFDAVRSAVRFDDSDQ